MKTILLGLVLFVFAGFVVADTAYVPIEHQERGSNLAYLHDYIESGELVASVATEWEKKNPDKVIICLSIQKNNTSEISGLWITYTSRIMEKKDLPTISTNDTILNLRLPDGVKHLGEGVLYFKGVESVFTTKLVQFISMNKDIVICVVCPNIVRQNRVPFSEHNRPDKEKNPHYDYGAPDGYYVIVRNRR